MLFLAGGVLALFHSLSGIFAAMGGVLHTLDTIGFGQG